MFMKKGSILIELYPYLINPRYITPYRTLASIMSLKYRLVTMDDRINSLAVNMNKIFLIIAHHCYYNTLLIIPHH